MKHHAGALINPHPRRDESLGGVRSGAEFATARRGMRLLLEFHDATGECDVGDDVASRAAVLRRTLEVLVLRDRLDVDDGVTAQLQGA